MSEGGVQVVGGPWHRWDVLDGSSFFAFTGPGDYDPPSCASWLREGCVTSAPIHQGFAAVLVEPDGRVSVVSGVRREVAAHFAVDHQRLVVGVNPRSVARAGPAPSLDLVKLADLLVLYDDPTTTVLSGIARLPLGWAMQWSPGHGTPRHWQWYRPERQPRLEVSGSEAVAMMRQAVERAVADSLPSDGDVAATLSGGLDSSMVVGVAAAMLHVRGRRLQTFTHVPLTGTPDPDDGWIADDGPDASRMAGCLPGVGWQAVVNETLEMPLLAARANMEKSWSPVLNAANSVWINEIMRRAERCGAELLLTGASGNASFSRSREGVLAQIVADRRLGSAAAQVRARHEAGDPWPRVLSELAGAVAPSSVRNGVRRRRMVRSRTPRFAESMPMRLERTRLTALEALARLESSDSRTREHWKHWLTSDPSLSLVMQDLADNVWWSDPLSAPEVVELALRLPDEAWVVGGLDRGLARAAAGPYVPDFIRLRQARGSQAADSATWLRGQEAVYHDLLDRFRVSPSVPEFIDVDRLATELAAGLPGHDRAEEWEATLGRAFSLGHFAVWYEDEVLSGHGR